MRNENTGSPNCCHLLWTKQKNSNLGRCLNTDIVCGQVNCSVEIGIVLLECFSIEIMVWRCSIKFMRIISICFKIQNVFNVHSIHSPSTIEVIKWTRKIRESNPVQNATDNLLRKGLAVLTRKENLHTYKCDQSQAANKLCIEFCDKSNSELKYK